MFGLTKQPAKITIQLTNGTLFSTDFAQHERQRFLTQLNALPTWAWECHRLLHIRTPARIYGCIVRIYKFSNDLFNRCKRKCRHDVIGIVRVIEKHGSIAGTSYRPKSKRKIDM